MKVKIEYEFELICKDEKIVLDKEKLETRLKGLFDLTLYDTIILDENGYLHGIMSKSSKKGKVSINED